MGTRSIVGTRRTDTGGFKGRYVHWDGYPAGVGAAVVEIVGRDGFDRAVKVLTQDHHGWSKIMGDKEPEFRADRDDWVTGYGVANDEGQSDFWVTDQDANTDTEWAYAITRETIEVWHLPVGGKAWIRRAELDMPVLSAAERFFYDHAGYSWNRETQNENEGHIETARLLAAAEKRLKDGPYFINVEPDPDPWDGDVPYEGPLWNVDLYIVAGSTDSHLIGSLGSVATETTTDPYIRVVSAELALEHIKEQ